MPLDPNKVNTRPLTGAASLFDPSNPGSNPVPNVNMNPMTGGPLAHIQDQQRWLTNQLLEPTTRLDIAGNRVDPTAPQGLDWLEAHGPNRASAQQRYDALGAVTGRMSPEQAGAASMFNHQHPLETNAHGDFMNQYGTGGVHTLGAGETPAPSTVGGQPMASWLFDQSFRTPEGTVNPAAATTNAHMAPDVMAQFQKDRGFTPPPGAHAPVDLAGPAIQHGQQQAAANAAAMTPQQIAGLAEQFGLPISTGVHPGGPSHNPLHGVRPTAPMQHSAATTPPAGVPGTAANFPSMSDALSHATKPLPDTGLYPAVRDNLYHGSGALGDWLMMKLFGTTLHNAYGEEGKTPQKKAPSPPLPPDPYGYAGM